MIDHGTDDMRAVIREIKQNRSEPRRTLGDMTAAELITSADSELSWAAQLATGEEPRTATLSDGTTLDLLTAAITSARSRLIVAQGKLTEGN